MSPSGIKAKKWWGIYNQIRTLSPFCKRLIINNSQVTRKIKWRILQFSREFSQRFRWHADSNHSIIMQCLNFCHTGGCKNSSSLKKALQCTFFNIAPQPGKTTSACKFLSNTNKCQDTAFCAGVSLNLGTSTPVAKIRHIFRCKFFKATYAACRTLL